MATVMTAEAFVRHCEGKRVRCRLIDGTFHQKAWHPHDRWHAACFAHVLTELKNWSRGADPRRAAVWSSVAVVKEGEPASAVLVDATVAFLDAALTNGAAPAGLLAVEIVDVLDTPDEIDDTVRVCLDDGFPMVWLIRPRERTVTVYRPAAEPVLLDAAQELDGGDVLPGFRCPVARLFE